MDAQIADCSVPGAHRLKCLHCLLLPHALDPLTCYKVNATQVATHCAGALREECLRGQGRMCSRKTQFFSDFFPSVLDQIQGDGDAEEAACVSVSGCRAQMLLGACCVWMKPLQVGPKLASLHWLPLHPGPLLQDFMELGLFPALPGQPAAQHCLPGPRLPCSL